MKKGFNDGVNKGEGHEEQLTEAWDDNSGQALDAEEVRKARRIEFEHARRKKVWVKITREEARRRGWRIIKTRWIYIYIYIYQHKT